MGEVKRYDPINSDGTCGMCIEDADYGAYVEYADYAALEAELAKLRAGQESLLLNLAEQKRQAVEYREMWARATERAWARGADLLFLAEYIVGSECGTALPNYEALGRYPLNVAEAALAAPSAPKADDPVKVQLLEALEGMLLHIREPESESEFQWSGHFKKQKAAFVATRAAIAAARKEGKV